MPTYEYRCPECGHEFERFQRMSDEPVAECPECGAAAERLISSGAGLLFKGEGFYITENRSESYRKKAESESGSKGESASSKGEGSKSESSSPSKVSKADGGGSDGGDAKGAD